MFHPRSTFRLPLTPDGPPRAGEDKRPTLIVRYGSAAQWIHYAERFAELEAESDQIAQLRGLADLIASMATAAQNLIDLADGQTIPNEGGMANALLRALTAQQLRDLAFDLPYKASLSELEKKKSERPSPSSTEESAADAGENASTPPPSDSPSSSNASAATEPPRTEAATPADPPAGTS